MKKIKKAFHRSSNNNRVTNLEIPIRWSKMPKKKTNKRKREKKGKTRRTRMRKLIRFIKNLRVRTVTMLQKRQTS